ncbi:hypothetical protein BB558_002663 [Smittium angustum]|uniref:Mei2-like C-terminal RNA recognition motif domain-containing protein n=1 Tax=Smittium angustum TaxID=133377 RepID=A0A2U1J815_SMIAN|nr:hypothetical protein BB558_002663 [Smittium angustum]
MELKKISSWETSMKHGMYIHHIVTGNKISQYQEFEKTYPITSKIEKLIKEEIPFTYNKNTIPKPIMIKDTHTVLKRAVKICPIISRIGNSELKMILKEYGDIKDVYLYPYSDSECECGNAAIVEFYDSRSVNMVIQSSLGSFDMMLYFTEIVRAEQCDVKESGGFGGTELDSIFIGGEDGIEISRMFYEAPEIQRIYFGEVDGEPCSLLEFYDIRKAAYYHQFLKKYDDIYTLLTNKNKISGFVKLSQKNVRMKTRSCIKDDGNERSTLGSSSVPEPVRFNIKNVLSGQDTRLMLMIRNIPNRYNKRQFLEWAMECGKGKFDFMYLRIDWNTKRNSGFGFIHFCDSRPLHESQKVCLFAYAEEQNLEKLMQRFNSKGMRHSSWEYQPSSFYTSGRHSGLEVIPYWALGESECNVNMTDS